jgi:chromosome segregation ATPase
MSPSLIIVAWLPTLFFVFGILLLMLLCVESVEASDDEDDEEQCAGGAGAGGDDDGGGEGLADEVSHGESSTFSEQDVSETIEEALTNPEEADAWETALIASLSEQLAQARLSQQKTAEALENSREERDNLAASVLALENQLQQMRLENEQKDLKLTEVNERAHTLSARLESREASSTGDLAQAATREKQLVKQVSQLRDRNVALRKKMSSQAAKTREVHAK